MSALHSAASVEWHTPPDIVNAVRHTLRFIALDPASSESANQLIQAHEYYSSSGLEKPWRGPLFVNPPGKSPSNPGGQAAWWNKLVCEWIGGPHENWEESVTENSWDAIFLGFSLELLQTAQRYDVWQPLDFMHCIPRKRIKFQSADGSPMKSPTHGNIICLLTRSEDTRRRFHEAFESIGYVGGDR